MRLALQVCPNRVIDPLDPFFIEYVLKAAQRGLMGEFISIREWPLPGGLMKQPARLVAATDLVLSELRAMQEHAATKREAKRAPERK